MQSTYRSWQCHWAAKEFDAVWNTSWQEWQLLADEELAGMAEVDAVVTGGGGADSSWEYSEALSKSPTGHDFGTSVINKKDEPVAEDEVRFISQG
uniref:Bm10425 n=1 Tax=Brugia malayi TaxID=6279 RepID=A0A0H5S8J2_BRUMA|nr:Bm10425 [Brugia malayi]